MGVKKICFQLYKDELMYIGPLFIIEIQSVSMETKFVSSSFINTFCFFFSLNKWYINISVIKGGTWKAWTVSTETNAKHILKHFIIGNSMKLKLKILAKFSFIYFKRL